MAPGGAVVCAKVGGSRGIHHPREGLHLCTSVVESPRAGQCSVIPMVEKSCVTAANRMIPKTVEWYSVTPGKGGGSGRSGRGDTMENDRVTLGAFAARN